MPCSLCRQAGHNSRTCTLVASGAPQQQPKEPERTAPEETQQVLELEVGEGLKVRLLVPKDAKNDVVLRALGRASEAVLQQAPAEPEPPEETVVRKWLSELGYAVHVQLRVWDKYARKSEQDNAVMKTTPLMVTVTVRGHGSTGRCTERTVPRQSTASSKMCSPRTPRRSCSRR